ncbi:septation protein SepH [Nocardioides sp.]|uniref:septation protein SepH n=1 Tax=Nocardioides sp. TaxID=35761 RepID=UPI003D0C3FAF
MLHLTLAGLSEDNRRLLLVSDAGEEFSLAIDAKLRAALRGEHARLGQLEIQMDSALRPRDIQARIRAGESPDAVAQAAQTTVDRILPYANPVLAERAHVASRAQRSSVRRPSGDAGGARTLGDAVAAMLRSQNVDPASVEWDAWRREDGRWALVGVFEAPKRKGTATFTFDAPGNYVTLDNEDAKWLVGEAVAKAAPRAKDDLQRARQRRLQSVAEDQLPLGGELSAEADDELGSDALSLVSEDPVVDSDLEATPEPLADEPAEHEVSLSDDLLGHEASVSDEPEPAPRPAKKKGRASVPSWDEIMFGGGKQD